MIYKLNTENFEITQVGIIETRAALEGFGWKKSTVNEVFVSAKVLFTHDAYYSRFRARLEEVRRARLEPEVIHATQTVM